MLLRVFQVAARRALRGARRVTAAGSAGPGAAAGRPVIRQLCGTGGKIPRGCTVDPNLEERFVFVDATGETPRLRYDGWRDTDQQWIHRDPEVIQQSAVQLTYSTGLK